LQQKKRAVDIRRCSVRDGSDKVKVKVTSLYMCVISPHNSAGMVSIMWCQIVKLSPAPDDMFAQVSSNRSDGHARANGIQKLLICREILECVQNLINPFITSVCKK
jgi:hypothetical protein